MGKYASIDYELLKKQRAEGWTMDRLAQWHGVSRWTIAEWLRRGAHIPTKRRYTGCCNHKDENPQNNHVDNLEWCTQCCAIGDDVVDGRPYKEIVEIARNYIKSIGGFEKFAEWGLI